MGAGGSTNSGKILIACKRALVGSNSTIPEFLEQIKVGNNAEIEKHNDTILQFQNVYNSGTLTGPALECMQRIIEQLSDDKSKLEARVPQLESAVNGNRWSETKKFNELIQILQGMNLFANTQYSADLYLGTSKNENVVNHVFFTKDFANTAAKFKYLAIVSDEEFARLEALFPDTPDESLRTRDADNNVVTLAIPDNTPFTPVMITFLDTAEKRFVGTYEARCYCGKCQEGGFTFREVNAEENPAANNDAEGDAPEGNAANQQEGNQPTIRQITMEEMLEMLQRRNQ